MLTFNFVLLHVADPVASVSFYSGLLGKPAIESEPQFAMLPLSDTVMLGLWLASDADPSRTGKPGASEISFDTADLPALQKLHDDWRARGLPILVEPVQMPFGHTFVAADPDGHRIRVVASNS
ncbi:lactoylglutathione lyase-like lyase [Hoeflea sp. IMCC20628]|uniref:VOC family protein n=1 Tax=Hoeflea sp. IMCC20628 TaxID=1620421 RepID=UPI00063A9EA2|nr:VOC family protein [Hoeflea sp. IMCC20628]AKI00625.1 lactoylglutathione lyase-like lyase [Hoeflea sp. IMCC20628]